MSVYLVAAAQENPQLGAAVQRIFPNDYKQISPSQWLIAANTTSQALGQQLGADKGQFGWHMIVPVANYWGWHDNDVWSWIEMKSGK